MTIFFSDLNFSTHAEQSAPDALLDQMSVYFEQVTRAIQAMNLSCPTSVNLSRAPTGSGAVGFGGSDGTGAGSRGICFRLDDCATSRTSRNRDRHQSS